MMIIFENDGEIDIRSIYTFGINVKVSDNPIGFFGTGLKYAISVLLRTGHKLTIFSGIEVIEFDVKRDDVRGKEFEFITMSKNGEAPFEIGFTTELGKTWDLWMAYRELACNMLDENGTVKFSDDRFSDDDFIPEIGRSKFMVEGYEFEAVFAMREKYILEDQPDAQIGLIQIRERPSDSFYYRDVKVMNLNLTSLFTYNDLQDTELTEDRTLKNQYSVLNRLVLAYLGCHDERILRAVLTAKEEFFEHSLDFDGWSQTPSDEFIKVVGELQSDRATNVNKSAYAVWLRVTRKNFTPKQIELTTVQMTSLVKALNFCEKIGFQIKDSYPIVVVESLGENCLGLAEDQTIYIAERAFQLGGSKQVASTLIEEYLHLKHDWRDMSRELQSFLFDKVVSLGEELQGEPL
jgi:hypothetical protein